MGERGAKGGRKKTWPKPMDIETSGRHHPYPQTLMDISYVEAVRLLLATMPRFANLLSSS